MDKTAINIPISLILLFLCLMFIPSVAFLTFFLFVYYLYGGGVLHLGRKFDYPVPTDSDRSGWPAVYETRLDNAFVPVLVSRLRADDIPVCVENKNLFNSGIHWEFGLSVPLRVKVPPDARSRAEEIMEAFEITGDDDESDES